MTGYRNKMDQYTMTFNKKSLSQRSEVIDIRSSFTPLSHHSKSFSDVHIARSKTAIPTVTSKRMYTPFHGVPRLPVQNLSLVVPDGHSSVTPLGVRTFSRGTFKRPNSKQHAMPGLHRSRTVLSTSHRHCDACTLKLFREFQKVHSGTGIRMEDAVHVFSMKRSKSDLFLDDMRPMTTSYLTQEKSSTYTMGSMAIKHEAIGNKEEAILPTAKVPKKGLIKLTADEDELQLSDAFGFKKADIGDTLPEKKKVEKKSTLIRRKDIRDQIMEGARMLEEEEMRKKMLEEEEEEEEEEGQIEDYTIRDLQSVLDIMNDDPNARLESIKVSMEHRMKSEEKGKRESDRGRGKGAQIPKPPVITETIKQTTFQLPFLGKK